MSAARLLRYRFRLTAVGVAAGCAAFVSTSHFRQTTRLDSAHSTSWPQESQPSLEANRSLQKIAKARPINKKKEDAPVLDPQDPPDSYPAAFEDDDAHAWASLSDRFSGVVEASKNVINGVEWGALSDRVRDMVVPAWIQTMPDLIQKLQFELSMKSGSLADEIWQDAQDPSINPEILWDARVRVSQQLCPEEVAFRQKRREHVVRALAKYLDIKEDDIDPDDVPTIAICGSGGGLRAMMAGASSYLCAQQAGLYDCVTYTAGVSGSCWLQSLYFSSLGKQDFEHLIQHMKNRAGTHIAFPPTALKLVTSAPTNKFLLSGWVEKAKGDPGGSYGIVDIYGLLLAARFLVPKGDLDVQDHDLKLSNQRDFLDGRYAGQHPMPIYTAVRHEIPIQEAKEEAKEEGRPVAEKIEEKAKKEAWFSWFEMSPFEVFCEDFGAGIPTWSLGRPFRKGRNIVLESGVALPELRQSLLFGLWGSAFCATLSHYRHELKLAGLVAWNQVEQLLEEKNDDLVRIHPIEPASIPNFVMDMQDQLPSTVPETVFKTDHLQLMDAGMSNNLPIYPLLRPGRDIDVLIAFDASADIQKENWLSVVDGYAKQRGVHAWPLGSGFPTKSSKPEETAKMLDEAQKTTPQEAAGKVAEAREESRQKNDNDGPPQDSGSDDNLEHCTVWVGTTAERVSSEEPPPSKRLSWDDPNDSTFHLTQPNSGLALIYFPLLPNSQVEGVDPDKTDFLSTWNFIYEPEQIDKLVSLARANFEEGADKTKRTVRAVYERKRQLRIRREEKSSIKKWKQKLRESGDHFA